MTHIAITKGLDIPISGKPEGSPQPLPLAGESSQQRNPHHLALDLSSFDEMKFKILVRLDESVKIGQPLVEDKESPGRFFVSPAGGVIREIRRGLKRRLLCVVIEVADNEELEQHPLINLSQIDRTSLVEAMKKGGLFTHIRQRPFNFLANPNLLPKSIFVKAIESAPFTPPAEMQVQGHEEPFQIGLNALKKLTEGDVHLVCREDSTCSAFTKAQGVKIHTASGPHPVSHPSVHIDRIDPIRSAKDVIWTLDARDVVTLGYFIQSGNYFTPRIISIAGPGVLENKTGYFLVREGYPVSALLSGRIKKGHSRLISGNPLNGHKVESEDFLGFNDTVFCVIPENNHREFLHFFRLGGHKYSYTGAYLSGHLDSKSRDYDFTTNQHGEKRAFIDSTLYYDVMPLPVSTMHLVKAIMAEDFDLAAELGLLEVDSEDFALPAFVDPSKIEMPEIVKKGLRRYAADILK